MWVTSLPWLVGSVLVVWDAMGRFNTPPKPLPRSTTTFERYYLSAVGYASLMLIAYIVLALTPSLLALAARSANAAAASSATSATQRTGDAVTTDIPKPLQNTPPLYAAILLTVVVSNVPFLRRMDDAVRGRLHELARIPTAARELSLSLRRRRLVPPAELRAGFDAWYEPLRVKPAWLLQTMGRERFNQWIRTSEILYVMEQTPELAAALATLEDDFRALKEKHMQLAAGLRRYAAVAEAARQEPLAERMEDDPLEQMRAELQERINGLYDNVCNIVSYVVLYAAYKRDQMEGLLRSIGFQESQEPEFEAAPVTRVAILVCILVAAVAFIFMTVQGAFNPRQLGENDLPRHVLVPMIAINLSLAGALGVTMGRSRRAAAASPTVWVRPWDRYLIVSMLAAAAGMAISAMFRLLCFRTGGTIEILFNQKWPWMILTACVCGAAAYLADDRRGKPQWQEGLMHAAVSVGAALVTLVLLEQTEGPQATGKIFGTLTLVGAIGFLVGALLPTASRLSERVQSEIPPYDAVSSDLIDDQHWQI